MVRKDAAAQRFVDSVERRSAAAQRFTLERTQNAVEDYLLAALEEARARAILLDLRESPRSSEDAGQSQPA